MKLALFALLFLESVFCQESCGLVGFTALTPDQLREEISTAIQENLKDFLDGVREREAEETEVYLAAVSMLESSVESINDSLVEVQKRVIREVAAVMEGFVSRSLKEAVANLTLAFREELASLGVATSAPPTTATPNGVPPTTATPNAVPPTTATPNAVPPTTATPNAVPPTTSTTPFPPIPLGFSPSFPALSCQHVQQGILGGVPSGNYWVTNSNTNAPVSVYCDMTRTCGNLTGGWMRVADIDMRDSAQQCPGDFIELVRDVAPRRLCTPNSNEEGCFSHKFPVSVQYSHVCGRVLAYQESTPNAFFAFHIQTSPTINDAYVDGISLTHGTPRSHVWTFAAALDETLGHLSGCECSNVFADPNPNLPPFVGRDYFCDTGSREDVDFRFYAADPLWDGQGCGQDSTCCSFNNPPWFFRKLASAMSDSLEMRVCRDSGPTNENTPFEVVELYVR